MISWVNICKRSQRVFPKIQSPDFCMSQINYRWYEQTLFAPLRFSKNFLMTTNSFQLIQMQHGQTVPNYWKLASRIFAATFSKTDFTPVPLRFVLLWTLLFEETLWHCSSRSIFECILGQNQKWSCGISSKSWRYRRKGFECLFK